ncbi:hypothetical protein EMCG_05002 [[Emmonsia] crescens]|uniref:Uncharacterized protein n=1 Tax=[Emmonsia] crescens TaxID=73230 RepID=A0A0G2J6R7_9EURO|nr:hypothetical protein EMCG_05002 [Emmonsia crescens UAMH 3008]
MIYSFWDWQQEFIRMKLDEFYTKQGSIQNLNLDDLMDQLANVSHRQLLLLLLGLPDSTANSTDECQCHYCENTGHIIKYCWFKNLNLANADWKGRNKGRIEALRISKNKNKDTDREDLLASHRPWILCLSFSRYQRTFEEPELYER